MSLWKDMRVCACTFASVCLRRRSTLRTLRETRISGKRLWGLDVPALVFLPPFLSAYVSRAAGHLQLVELSWSTTTALAQCTHLALSPHAAGLQRGDAWPLMIEPSLANRRYHLCKPSPAPNARSPHKRYKGENKCMNYLITKREAQREIPGEMIIESGLSDFRIRAKKKKKKERKIKCRIS